MQDTNTDYQPPLQAEIERGGCWAILYRQEADPQSPFTDLQNRGNKIKKFAVISRNPTPDNMYYPIPYYAALFKGKWFNIKWDMTLDTAQYKRMYQRISAVEISILRIGEYPIPSIIDIVNSIRLAKGNVFAEWKQSDTAKLFEDHGYKNKKQAGGYFF